MYIDLVKSYIAAASGVCALQSSSYVLLGDYTQNFATIIIIIRALNQGERYVTKPCLGFIKLYTQIAIGTLILTIEHSSIVCQWLLSSSSSLMLNLAISL